MNIWCIVKIKLQNLNAKYELQHSFSVVSIVFTIALYQIELHQISIIFTQCIL